VIPAQLNDGATCSTFNDVCPRRLKPSAALRPLPPVTSAQPKVRYFHVHEGDTINEQQFTAWVKQASKLPSWGGS
jgi:hypothetical protein